MSTNSLDDARRSDWRREDIEKRRVLKKGRLQGVAFGAVSATIICAIVALVTGGRAEQKSAQPAAEQPANETSMASTTVSTESQPAKKASRKMAPAPAESAPSTGTDPWVKKNLIDDSTPGPRYGKIEAPKPAAPPVFEAKIASDLQDLVSFKLTGNEKAAETFDALVTAAGNKFEAAEKNERVFSRSSGAMAITGVTVNAENVTVTFKANPLPEQLQKLTKPMQELTQSLGLPTEGTWTGDGSVKTFVFRTGMPAGTMK